MSTIELQPAELLDCITSFLDAASFESFRLTSTQICTVTFFQFKRRYFSKLFISLDAPTLDRFVELSTWKPLADSIEQLAIRMHEHSPGPLPSTDDGAQVSPLQAERDRFFDDVTNENFQKDSVVSKLANALEGCTNLREILFGQLTYLGSSYNWLDYITFQGNCFGMLLDAIIKSGIKLQRLTTDTVKVEHGSKNMSCVPYTAFSLSIPELLKLSEVFVDLTVLTLCIDLIWKGYRAPGWENGLSQFISAAPTLEKLSLRIEKHGASSYFSVPMLRSLRETTRLSKLNTFELHSCKVHQHDIAEFTQNHRSTLRKLTMIDVILSKGTWKAVFEIWRDSLDLEELRLKHLWQGEGTVRWSNPPSESTDTFSVILADTHAGCVMSEALMQLVHHHKVAEFNWDA